MARLGNLFGAELRWSRLRTWIYLGTAYVMGFVTAFLFLATGVPSNRSEPPRVSSDESAKTHAEDLAAKIRAEERRERFDVLAGVLMDPLGRAMESRKPHWFDVVEEAFAKLWPAVIAFNAPEAIAFDKTIPIELLLSLTEPIEELQNQLTAMGKKHGFEIRASSQMEATLRAARDSAFKVVAVTPEIQNLRAKESTRWLWRVTPVEWGSQELELTISAIYSLNGRDGKRALRTFQHIILVNVTYWQRTQIFLKKNWQWVWTALLVPIVGGAWVWVRRRRKRSTFPE